MLVPPQAVDSRSSFGASDQLTFLTDGDRLTPLCHFTANPLAVSLLSLLSLSSSLSAMKQVVVGISNTRQASLSSACASAAAATVYVWPRAPSTSLQSNVGVALTTVCSPGAR